MDILKVKEKMITSCLVSYKFSREIFHWDNSGCYWNPKFAEYWDKVYSRRKKGDDEVRCWTVLYSTPLVMTQEDTDHPITAFRMFYNLGSKVCIPISNEAKALFTLEPSNFLPTTEVAIGELFRALTDCADYCQGTVRLEFSNQQRFIFDDKVHGSLYVEKEDVCCGSCSEIRSWENPLREADE